MMRGFGLPLWVAGVAVSFALPVVPPWAWSIVLWLVLLAAAWRFRAAGWAWVCLSGMLYGIGHTQWQLAKQWPLSEEVVSVPLTVQVIDLSQADRRRVRFVADAVDESGKHYRLRLSDYHLRDWPAGSRWQVSARVRAPVGEVNLRGLNREAWALASGFDGWGTVGKERKQLSGRAGGLLAVREAISLNWQQADMRDHDFSDGLSLMRALSLGEKSALRADIWQTFRPLGLNHLVSISGLHVGMVALLAGWLMKQILRLWPFVPKIPRLWILAAGLTAALLYAGLAGFSVPTQRSVLMLSALAWAWWCGNGVAAWRGWWQALALVLLFDPQAVLSAGLWLSFGLVGALLWVSSGRLKTDKGWRQVLRAQWAVSVLSAVALGSIFASLPLISPLVNMVAVPWFSWVLVPLALLASLVPLPALQWLAAGAGEYTLRALAYMAQGAPEYAVAAAPPYLLLLAVVSAWLLLLPRGSGWKPFACLVLLGFVVYRPPEVAQGRLKITVWDAGQGLSVWMQTHRHHLLFDTGTEPTAVMNILPSLNAAGVRHLDMLVLSHHDADHDGGFRQVNQAKKPQLIMAGQPEFYNGASLCEERYWFWDGVYFEFLRPSETLAREDNDKSCVLRVLAAGQSLLVTGDLRKSGESALVNEFGEKLYSQVLILGHHGSGSSSSGRFLNTVSPRYAVASSGYANAYKHPAKAVRRRLRAHGITLLRTDLSGALVFELGNEEQDVFIGRLKDIKPYWQKKPFN
ncbi:DNA internalization-related competence protein ComEC/Rec2 [Neisseria zalophi]|uniref:DNA internalization-related competence protein ComEC/Rec2 n=2 Tax=Neisseria zalophi TaxID=640030 RepID=A0A5J6Q1P8_9NEIS|nr:DNA internalization-related competence protein ComEC/Rec2 [Neisseria zalophi]QEY26860.1 DNA internalization-related competence protein ComEC/Rec2 [Neisseria zalophi]